jgi:hypothetical protein
MSAANYDQALARLLVHEGGYTNHPADPGGPTNFGITIFDYRKYVKPDATAADVKAMKLDEAKAIYRAKYWGLQRCDDMPAGVDDSVFDYGVNSGVGRSGKVLRRVLGLDMATGPRSDCGWVFHSRLIETVGVPPICLTAASRARVGDNAVALPSVIFRFCLAILYW